MKKILPILAILAISSIVGIMGLVGLIYFLWIKPNQPDLLSQECGIKQIHSSNSISLVCEGEIKQVRLCGIDAQPTQEKEAKKLITSLVENHETESELVSVVLINDLAEIYLPAKNPEQEKMLSMELLLRGLAKFNERDNCPNSVPLEQVQAIAKQAKVGVWQ
jgi:endonuclease YncB( thermonuclease family)